MVRKHTNLEVYGVNTSTPLVNLAKASPMHQSEGKVGTLRSEDGDGRENVAEKVNSRSFNLHRDYSESLTLSNVGEPS